MEKKTQLTSTNALLKLMPVEEETPVSKMLMLFLITAALLEMAHDINHLLLLSSRYG